VTKILRLELKGFKSFAKRTLIPFGNGFNVVLGPNGSGKSNILDALCFVLGKRSSKSLRAEKAGDLVFKAKTGKTPQQASVAIAFDNGAKVFPIDASEVLVTRSVKPDGNSVYLINDQKSSLQQVTELLSHAKVDPEGYNIILQGDIVKFVEMSTEERRRLIEEISGISLYEEKKHRAMQELDKVDKKLTEAEIVLEQRRVHLEELRKDRDQAAKYRETKTRSDQLRATLISLDMRDLAAKGEKLEKEKAELEAKSVALKEDIDRLKKESAETRAKSDELSRRIEEGGEKEQRELFRQKEELRVAITRQEERLRTCKDELQKLNERKEALLSDAKSREGKLDLTRKEISRLDDLLRSLARDTERMEKETQAFKKKHNIEDQGSLEEQISTSDRELETLNDGVNLLRQQQQDLVVKKERAQVHLDGFGEQLRKVQEVQRLHKEEVQQLQQKRDRYKSLVLDLTKSTAQDSGLAAQLSKLREQELSRRGELSRLQIVQSAQRERTASDIAVKRILEEKTRISGIHGTVSELGEVPSRYAMALEVAAGPRLQQVVVDSEDVASQCIKFLRDNRLGVVTFLPLSKIHGSAPENLALKKATGVVDFAVNLVEHKAQHKKVFQYVFGQTLVVETLDVAKRIGIGKARMVTLEGDLTELSGAMSGGHRVRREGTGFSVKEAASSLKRLEAELAKLAADIAEDERERSSLAEKIDSLRSEKSSLEGEISAMEKRLHLEEGDLEVDKQQRLVAQADLERADKELVKLMQNIAQSNQRIIKLKTERELLRQQLQSLREPRVLAELNSFIKTREELRDKTREAELSKQSRQRELKDILEPEVQRAAKLVEENDKQAAAFSQEQLATMPLLAESKKSLAEMEKALVDFYEKNKKLFEEREGLQRRLEELSASLGDLEAKRTDADTRSNSVALRLAEAKAMLAGKEKEFEPFSGVPLLEQKSKAAMGAELAQYDQLLLEMGTINMKALEIYEAVEQEFKNLMEKKEKLSTEKLDVLTMMTEIEGKKKELFLHTFAIVEQNFRRIFKELAPKGEAWLILENEESPLDAGVEIQARMSEKRPLPIRSLSGGEKTLTALAFIFAIQEHEPASFYILDEVDAALDKHNSEKFAKLVRKYSDRAQYVIVSHNDYVLGEADWLFGISMDKEGESTVRTLKV